MVLKKHSEKKKIKFGFCVPVFANPGRLFFRTPAYKKLDWNSIKKTVIKCEKSGFDSLFVADHLFLGRNGEIWECLSLMAALAAITKKIWIYPIHLCNNFRSPGLVAKAFSTISHISEGRVGLFYDYGWRESEFKAYGTDFGKSTEERIAQMSEGLTIVKGLLEKKNFSFSGKYYNYNNAVCNPKPIKKIPIWMGEANHPLMVREIVKNADVFNSMPCSPESFKDKIKLIKKECKKQSRNYSSFGFSLETQILVCKTEREVKEKISRYAKMLKYNNSFDQDVLAQLKATNPGLTDYSSLENLKKEFLIGTPDGIKKKLDLYISAGVNHFMLWFMDYPDTCGIELFAKEILCNYK